VISDPPRDERLRDLHGGIPGRYASLRDRPSACPGPHRSGPVQGNHRGGQQDANHLRGVSTVSGDCRRTRRNG